MDRRFYVSCNDFIDNIGGDSAHLLFGSDSPGGDGTTAVGLKSRLLQAPPRWKNRTSGEIQARTSWRGERAVSSDAHTHSLSLSFFLPSLSLSLSLFLSLSL